MLNAVEYEILRNLRDQDFRRFRIKNEDFEQAVALLNHWGFLRVNPIRGDSIPLFLTDAGFKMLREIEESESRYH